MEDGTGQMKSFLRPSEASTRFDVPLRTIYTWYHFGRIDGVIVGEKSLRIYAHSLVEFLRVRNCPASE